jgi:hypothetical protein
MEVAARVWFSKSRDAEAALTARSFETGGASVFPSRRTRKSSFRRGADTSARHVRSPEYGWLLFAFNGGVEISQGCIVLTVAPSLALLRCRSPRFSERVVTAGALCVVTAGAFWFFQRVMA